MSPDLSITFDQFADKTVSLTDKKKRAYVLTRAQYDILTSARVPFYNGGSSSAPSVIFDVLNSPGKETVEASFYGSMREGSGRPFEARMGREFISTWLQHGDTLRIGRKGNRVYVLKLGR